MTRILRVGIGGPVGAGKSMLIERVVPFLAKKNYRVCIISNDEYQKRMLIEYEKTWQPNRD